MIATDVCAPNIYRSRNDWGLSSMKCKKFFVVETFEEKLRRIIKKETGFDPIDNVKYRGSRYNLSRQLFMSFMSTYSGLTFSAIGDMIAKDHSTVIHSVKSINNRYETDKRFREMYDRIDVKMAVISYNTTI